MAGCDQRQTLPVRCVVGPDTDKPASLSPQRLSLSWKSNETRVAARLPTMPSRTPATEGAIRAAARLMRSDPFIVLRDAAAAVSAPQRGLRCELLSAALRRCLPARAPTPTVSVSVTKSIAPETIRRLAPSGVRAVYEGAAASAHQAAGATHGTAAWWYRTNPSSVSLLPASGLRRWAVLHPDGIAEHPECPPAALLRFCARHDHNDPYPWDNRHTRDLESAARNPLCPPAVLAYAAAFIYPSFVAEHPNCPPAVLAALADSADMSTRKAAAAAANLPTKAAQLLAAAPEEEVRARLGSFNTCPELLTRLAGDPSILVRSCVAANPDTPLAVVAQLAEGDDHNVMMQDALEDNPAWPPPTEPQPAPQTTAPR